MKSEKSGHPECRKDQQEDQKKANHPEDGFWYF
jgi:hypothetical protein